MLENYELVDVLVPVIFVVIMIIAKAIHDLGIATLYVSLKDRRISRGILERIDNNINLTNDGGVYSFILDGFSIKVGSSLYVDDIRIYCPYFVLNRILLKLEGIYNRDEVEHEEMTRKDIFIHFGKK